MTMVEKVARAIHDEFQADFPRFTRRELDGLDEATGVAERFRRMARAAIQALREPHEAMVEVGRHILEDEYGVLAEGAEECTTEILRAAIDAALREDRT
jgi:hypothetical protein